jgi:hypothetical protein
VLGRRANPQKFQTTLKDVTRIYCQAMERYTQAMAVGDVDRADTALARMQEIEQQVTVIVHGEARL